MPYWRRTDLTAYAFADMQLTGDAGTFKIGADAPAGVIVMPLSQAVHDHAALVQAHLGSAVSAKVSKYAALNAATWRDGWFVYVPKNIERTHHLNVTKLCGEVNTFNPPTLPGVDLGRHRNVPTQTTCTRGRS